MIIMKKIILSIFIVSLLAPVAFAKNQKPIHECVMNGFTVYGYEREKVLNYLTLRNKGDYDQAKEALIDSGISVRPYANEVFLYELDVTFGIAKVRGRNGGKYVYADLAGIVCR